MDLGLPVLDSKPAEPNLVCIPRDMILEIANHLLGDVAALKHLRLTHLTLAAVATTTLFEEIHVALLPPSLKRLNEVASNRDVPEWSSVSSSMGRCYTSTKHWRIGRGRSRESKYPFKSSMLDLYSKYTSYLAMQSQFIDSLKFGALNATNARALKARHSFEAAIAKLVSLTQVRVVAYDDRDNLSNFWRKYSDKIAFTPANWRPPRRFPTGMDAINDDAFREDKGRLEGFAFLTSLLKALADSPGRLRRLTLTAVGREPDLSNSWYTPSFFPDLLVLAHGIQVTLRLWTTSQMLSSRPVLLPFWTIFRQEQSRSS
ncbi:uncharacterized protein BDZ99DRAFT_524141 [Mytilinidion resinicola]|uniref:Uncharacterized protein n=1 Tax=Mytilinidion resinicola TaxID=574789 RepID=A0A6A6YDH5_9PEZI|nr:uncharacterized protein BDZ99DRAFT_524141 [Mytilinidion resinicola]KAF2805897.1 hypothetical protein BDZ99DRAFT_524141 [Mytilinidion resinicola]